MLLWHGPASVRNLLSRSNWLRGRSILGSWILARVINHAMTCLGRRRFDRFCHRVRQRCWMVGASSGRLDHIILDVMISVAVGVNVNIGEQRAFRLASRIDNHCRCSYLSRTMEFLLTNGRRRTPNQPGNWSEWRHVIRAIPLWRILPAILLILLLGITLYLRGEGVTPWPLSMLFILVLRTCVTFLLLKSQPCSIIVGFRCGTYVLSMM